MDTISVTIREVLRSKLSLYCWSYKRWLSVHKFEGTVLGLSELTKELVDLVILDQLQAVTPSSLSSKLKDPHLYICMEDSVYIGSFALSIRVVKKY